MESADQKAEPEKVVKLTFLVNSGNLKNCFAIPVLRALAEVGQLQKLTNCCKPGWDGRCP